MSRANRGESVFWEIMRTKSRIFALLFILIAALAPGTVFADNNAESENTGVTSGTGIQLREQAVNGKLVKKLNSGIRVTIEEENQGKDGMTWYKVSCNEPAFKGYVRSDFIDKNGVAATELKEGSSYSVAYDGVKIKEKPGNNEKTLCVVPSGTVCSIKKAVYDDDSGYYWFNVTFNPVGDVGAGYVRYDYLNLDDFADELRQLGFPESYITPLCTVHSLYPGWSFKPYDPAPGMTFQACVDVETPVSVMGTSSGTAGSVTGLDDIGDKSVLKDFETLLNGPVRGRGTASIQGLYEGTVYWDQASKNYVAYYMDPRNFMVKGNGGLNESFFMFLSGTDIKGTNERGVGAILSTTSMTGSIPGESTTYAAAVFNKSSAKGINPYLVAARMRQEHGNPAGDDLINGNYSGYVGYYNYFNIRANGSNVVVNGLQYAKEQGWDSRVKSINGGIDHLADNYFLSTAHTQDTLYKQRFFFSNGSYSHQYMTSIYAPHHEAKHVAAGYGSDNSDSSEGVFLIPVYKDMPETPCSIN